MKYKGEDGQIKENKERCLGGYAADAPHLEQRFRPPDLLSCRICVDRRLMEYVMLQQAGTVDAVTSEGDAGGPGEDRGQSRTILGVSSFHGIRAVGPR